MKKAFWFLIIINFIFITTAQNKILSPKDCVTKAYTELRPKTIFELQWLPNTNDFVFLSNDYKSFKIQNAESKKVKLLFSIDQLNNILTLNNFNKLKFLPYVNFISPNEFYFKNKFLKINLKNKTVDLLFNSIEAARNITFSKDLKKLSFTKKNNLFVVNSNHETINISKEKNPHIIFGQSVHRDEFGINGGMFWSPKSNKLAFYRMDETMVTDYPIVDYSVRPAKVEYIKYPMAGDKSHHVTVGVYSLKSKKTIYLQTGLPAEKYLTTVTWTPDEKYILIAELNRGQDHLQVVKYDAETGKRVKVLFEETDKEFVEPETPIYFLPNSNNKFLWHSERTGFKHIYLYDLEGNLIKQITNGDWVVTNFNGFDKNNNIYITTTKETPIERHLYKVSLTDGTIKKLTSESGVHNIKFNGKYFIDSYSNLETPPVIKVKNNDGKELQTLLKAKNPFTKYTFGKTKIFTIKANDGTDLYCRMTLPVNFDKSKKYPAIVYVYGGPHSQDVQNKFPMGRYALWARMMSQKGYIVFYCDNRGTDNRGTKFEQATHRRLGTIEIADQLKGVEYLKSTGFVDENRLGVWGWSFGGFMTTSLMLRTNNTFKVGVAGGAVINWKYYEIMYTERYMDTPQENPEGFETANLLNYVQNLKGKLLLVHGTSDPVVLWQHTLMFAKKAASLNVPLDYFPYVGHPHGVGGKDAIQLYNKITNYFLNNL